LYRKRFLRIFCRISFGASATQGKYQHEGWAFWPNRTVFYTLLRIVISFSFYFVFFIVLDCTFSLSLLSAQIKKEKKYQKERKINATI